MASSQTQVAGNEDSASKISQTQNEPIRDSDYTLSRVPAEAKQPFWRILVIRIGSIGCVSQLVLGASLGYGMSFWGAFWATMLGSVLLQVISWALGTAAAREGLSTSLLSRWTGFGKMGSAIFGGVTMGAGLGMVVRAGATTGGTDMAAMIVHAHLSMFTVPMVLFTIDGIVVVVAALNFGVQAGLFALIALFVSTKTMDSVIKGFNTAMQFLIISPNQEEIVRRIHTEMDRGCTRLEATGTYEGRKNGALLCVVPRMEASRLKKIVSECDAHAFVTVCDVHEALGEGFSYRHIS